MIYKVIDRHNRRTARSSLPSHRFFKRNKVLRKHLHNTIVEMEQRDMRALDNWLHDDVREHAKQWIWNNWTCGDYGDIQDIADGGSYEAPEIHLKDDYLESWGLPSNPSKLFDQLLKVSPSLKTGFDW